MTIGDRFEGNPGTLKMVIMNAGDHFDQDQMIYSAGTEQILRFFRKTHSDNFSSSCIICHCAAKVFIINHWQPL